MKVKLIIPKQEMEVGIGEEFQVKGNIQNIETKFLLLHAVSQPEMFLVCQESFADTKKHWIEDEHTFNELGKRYSFSWEDIPEAISLAKINEYETGNTILWDKNKEDFVVGTKARDIYFTEEPVVGGMKGVWARRVYLDEIATAGFNYEINYNFRHRSEADKAKTLEEGKKYGIKIIPDLTSFFVENNIEGAISLVRKWKNNSSIGGWQLFDEPQLRRVPIADQISFYNRIKEIDSINPLSIAFMADNMKPEYYSPEAFDIPHVDYYPVRPDYDWKELLERNILRWISSTGNKDIIPALQGHFLPSAGLASPVGTIQGQCDMWKAHGLTDRGYTIYEWFTSGGDGIAENPTVLAEVTKMNNET